MEVSIIISNGVKQVMFTPENDNEKQALKMITPDDNIELAIKEGSFYDKGTQPAGYNVGMCQGGYLRAWQNQDSIMLVLTPKVKGSAFKQ